MFLRIRIIMMWTIVTVTFRTTVLIENPPATHAVAKIPGDFIIGLFVSAHHIPKGKPDNSRDFLKCGEVSLIFFNYHNIHTF